MVYISLSKRLPHFTEPPKFKIPPQDTLMPNGDAHSMQDRERKDSPVFSSNPDEYYGHKPNSGNQKRPKGDSNSLTEDTTAVPNPIPDTGFHATSAPSGISHSALSHLYTIEHLDHKPSITPASPIPHSAYAIHTFSTQVPLSSLPARTPSLSQAESPDTTKLPVAVVALLAVGSACALVAAFIVYRACRPRPRPRLTPSLPILDDTLAGDGGLVAKSSPVFGGKERVLSSQSGHPSTLWAWAPYYPEKINLVSDGPDAEDSKSLVSDRLASRVNEVHLPDNGIISGKQRTPLSSIITPQPYPLPKSSSNVTSRFSTASESMCYTSPVITDVDSAIGRLQPFTADEHCLLQRPSNRRSKSMSGEKSNYTPQGLLQSPSRRSSDLPYMTSPSFIASFPNTPVTSVGTGRTRIKSSYFTSGSYPRMSAIPSLPPSVKSKSDHHRHPALTKSNSRRERDTQALNDALGLASPIIPTSPQPTTIFPDDLMSIAGSQRRTKQSHRKVVPRHSPEKAIPSAETSIALGSLMLQDYSSNLNKTLTTRGTANDLPTTSNNSKVRLHKNDRPPRVPSPPTLPSLAQMGLEHANPDAYAEYRSPTYSIYGLYEGSDSKSKASLHRIVG